MRKKKINLLTEQILFYAKGQVQRAVAESEAEDYLKRKSFGGLFVHGSSLSSAGKKLAMKCMGRPFV